MLRYICVQPRILYYAWQVEVMLNNFIKQGIDPNHIDILVAWNPNDNTSSPENIKAWDKVANHFEEVKFYLYQDTRTNFNYIPSIYFNILKQHIKALPGLSKQALFLHDCDILLTRPVDFSSMLKDDIWYLSDTVGYIGTQYILTKGNDVYEDMCKIIGIDSLIPKLLNSNSGGAQHIVKNITYEYLDKVEKDSIKLYEYFCNTEHLHAEKGREGYPIQKWTAGMWALLWNAWLFGHETKVDKRLDFSWATDDINKWDETSIYHNSGVTCSCSGMFYKGDYTNSLPYGIEGKWDKTKNSYNYLLEIQETGKKSCLL